MEIVISNVSLSYGSRDILSSLDFTISSKQRILLQWPSWSGKTSILHLLAGLQNPKMGSIRYNIGQNSLTTDLSEFTTFRRDTIGMTFSEPLFFDNLSVQENISFPKIFLGKQYRQEWKDRLLSTLKIDKLLHSKVWLLSSGEKDRVNIIRALLYDDPIIFLDEPGAHMDSSLFEEFLHILQEYLEFTHSIIVIVSHSDKFAAISDRTFICENGSLLEKK